MLSPKVHPSILDLMLNKAISNEEITLFKDPDSKKIYFFEFYQFLSKYQYFYLKTLISN